MKNRTAAGKKRDVRFETGKRDSSSRAAAVVTLLALVSAVRCHGPHHPRGPHHHYKPIPSKGAAVPKLTRDADLLRDETHIKEDMSSWIPELDTSKMSSQELEFHYFKVHDFDNNVKLDGLEILQAIRHAIHDHFDDKIVDDVPSNPDELQYYIELIDRVLAEDDLDGDGYLSYIEYVLGRERDKKEQPGF